MGKEPILPLFGLNVQKYRKERNLSQEKLQDISEILFNVLRSNKRVQNVQRYFYRIDIVEHLVKVDVVFIIGNGRSETRKPSIKVSHISKH